MKIEGVSIAKIAKKEETVVRTTIKTQVQRLETARDHASVIVAKHDLNSAANLVKARLTNAFAAVAKPAAAPLSADEAKAKADAIIASNGGRDNLDTEGVGRDLAEMAKTDPAGARAVQLAMFGNRIDEDGKGKLEEGDKDEIAQSFAESLSDGDIAKLAASNEGRAMLERFERHLLSGSVHGDERRAAERFETELSKVRTFSHWNDGIDPLSDQALSTSYGTAFDTSASPEDAAAGLKQPYNHSTDGDVQAFTTQLEAHKDDPQWIQRYYAALGKDKAAELIGLAASPGGYSNYGVGMYGSKDAAAAYERNMATIAQSLDALRQSGTFGQEDMNILVDSLAKNGMPQNVVPDLFAKATPEVREMFVRAAEHNGSPQMAAAGAYVLGTMTDSKKAEILSEFARTDGRLESFVKNAMSGQFEAMDMSNYLSTGIADKYTPIGAQSILQTAARGAEYLGSTLIPSPLSDDVKLKMFDGAMQGLTDEKTFSNLSGDTGIKDAIAGLAISQHDAFVNRALDADGGKSGEDFDSKFQNQYSKLMQFALFTPPLGSKSGDLMKFIDNKYKTIAADLGKSESEFRQKYNREPLAMAHALGEMTGLFFRALDDGLTKVKGDAEKAAEIMDPIFKIADFATGKLLDKAGPWGKAISTLLDLTGASDAAKDKIKEMIKNGQIKEAIQEMLDAGIDVSKLADELYENVHNDLLPNGSELKDRWQNGYDHIEGAPKKVN